MPTFCRGGCRKRVNYAGNSCKACAARLGVPCDPEGQRKAYNARTNPSTNAHWNPINSAKVQERSRKHNEARISKMRSNEKILSERKAKSIAKQIMACKRKFKRRASIYVGYTKRMIGDEMLGWLAGGNPTLRWADGNNITKTQATTQLGFRAVEVYTSTLKVNARKVEAALQCLNQHLKLGKRLWRKPDMGAKYDKKIDGSVHKVFITYSTSVNAMCRAGSIKINH